MLMTVALRLNFKHYGSGGRVEGDGARFRTEAMSQRPVSLKRPKFTGRRTEPNDVAACLWALEAPSHFAAWESLGLMLPIRQTLPGTFPAWQL